MGNFIDHLCFKIINLIKYRATRYMRSQLAECESGAFIQYPASCGNFKNIHLKKDSHLFENFNFVSRTGNFYMGEGSTTGIGLSIITNTHKRVLGHLRVNNHSEDYDQDIIVEEDVLFGAFVTLMDGCRIGRGATIGAGSVIRNNVPPYSIVVGNPAKVVGFSFTPEQIIEHEKNIYPKEKRLPLELLEKNYEKYFIKRMKEIRNYMSI